MSQNFSGGWDFVAKEKQSKNKTANLILNVLNGVAVKNANSACRGLIYEPKVSKKLREK